MILFDRDTAGNLTPKPWTAPQPPTPFDRSVFNWQTVVYLSLIAAGFVLAVVEAPPVVSLFVTSCGAGWGAVHCAVQIRRWWHEVRWMTSPSGLRALDDEGLS